MSDSTNNQPPRSWKAKFADAARGLAMAVRRQSSFVVHLSAAAAVVVAAITVGMNRIEWCLLLGCIAAVLVAEMFNTALELIAKAVTRDANPHIRAALDVAAATVLVVAIGAAMIGAILFLNRLAFVLGWWSAE